METTLLETDAVTPPAVEVEENVPAVVEMLAFTARETLPESMLNVGVQVYVSPGLR